MTPRRRAILVVGLILILIAIVALSFLLLRKTVQPSAPAPAAQAPVDAGAAAEPTPSEPAFVNPLIAPAAADAGPTGGRQIAELFAERYGSYSNQGDYQNLRDLLPVMTTRYRQETEAYLKTAPTASGQTFEGVTSKKVSTDVRSSGASSSVIAVTLQQEKTSGGTAPTIAYRTLRMELKKVGEDWRIDRASWED